MPGEGPNISRRHAMALGVAGMTAAAAKNGGTNGYQTDESPPDNTIFSATALQHDLEIFDGFGIHRTGSAADQATGDWMAELWDELGYRVERQTFTTPNYDTTDAKLSLSDGSSIDLLAQPPFYDMPADTPETGLVYANVGGPRTDASGAILVADTAFARHSSVGEPQIAFFVDMARQCQATALVLIPNGPSGRGTLLNINPSTDYPRMAIAHPNEAGPLRSAAISSETARLTTPPPAIERSADNIIGTLDRGPKRLVVSTPISGWTHCAAERGPGVATIRAISRWLCDHPINYSVTLCATSGHELGGMGMKHWLDTSAPNPIDTDFWVHLGAGWAARNWHETPVGLLPMTSSDPQRYLMASDSAVIMANEAFRGLGGLADVYPLRVQDAAGELRDIAERRYNNVVGAFAAHKLHHVMDDRMNAVSGELVSPVANGFRSLIAMAASTMLSDRAL